MPRVTVVVPVYKVERYLSRCVDSILTQTYKDYELVLVDDGSPDNCGRMCDEYENRDKRVHVIHRENGGLSAARNSGIEWALANSDSEWITFIDSDDWIHQQYLELLLKAANDHTVNVVIGTFVRTDGETGMLDDTSFSVGVYEPEEYWMKNQTNATTAWGKLYQKEDFRELRYPEGKLHEDQYTTYQILFRYSIIAVVEEPIYYYFINAQGITKSKWIPQRLDILEALTNQIDFFSNHHNDEAYLWAAWCYLDAICDHMRAIRESGHYQEYIPKLRKDLKKGIRQYKKDLSLSYQSSFRFYKYAYPLSTKILIKLHIIKQQRTN